MEENDTAYIELRRHLDQQAVGFPETRSGAEIRILKHIFTPREARIATAIGYKPEPLDAVFERVRNTVSSIEELEEILAAIQKKGGIESEFKNGATHYRLLPLVVGMYEMQVDRLTPEFIKDFNTYVSDKKFGVALLSTALPQLRTIPVARSLDPGRNVQTFDAILSLIQGAAPPFVVLECICRKKRAMEGKPCKVTDRRDTCIAVGNTARSVRLMGVGQEVSRETLISILEQNQRDGLVLQTSNTEDADFICSCCGCCCGMLQIQKHLPHPLNYWVSNFQAVVDPAACTGCDICRSRCQVNAIRVEESGVAVVDENRCIGCGLCVTTCPTNALALVQKEHATRPPRTREDLHDIMMAEKNHRMKKRQ